MNSVDIFIPGVTREVLPYIVRFTRPKSGMNFVLYSDLDESNADGVIAEQVTCFSSENCRLSGRSLVMIYSSKPH
ncbi:MAG: hypothetical protein R3C44_22045 [Chloroflexota bacterium]